MTYTCLTHDMHLYAHKTCTCLLVGRDPVCHDPLIRGIVLFTRGLWQVANLFAQSSQDLTAQQ